MNTVTQTMKFRQSLLSYAEKHGVTQAAIKDNVNRQYIYRLETDLLPPRTITAAKIVPAANSEASVSNPPTR